MDIDLDYPVLLFDGECGLCNRVMQWILGHERAPKLRFASLQSERIKPLFAAGKLPKSDSILLIENGIVYDESEAVLRILGYLRFPWFLLRAFGIFPKSLLDVLYRWVSRNRHRWFGKADSCEYKPQFDGRILD
ncbi:MAG: DCC1-like thiol-disulfide oxidoreductase family protein [Saprospiraceae bacterium]